MCVRPGQRGGSGAVRLGVSTPRQLQAKRQRTGGLLTGAKVREWGGWGPHPPEGGPEGSSVCFCLGRVCRELIPPECAQAPRAQESEAGLGSEGDGTPVTTQGSLLGVGAGAG